MIVDDSSSRNACRRPRSLMVKVMLTFTTKKTQWHGFNPKPNDQCDDASMIGDKNMELLY